MLGTYLEDMSDLSFLLNSVKYIHHVWLENTMGSAARILRMKEVCKRLAVSRSTLYNWLDLHSKYSNPDFPRPFRIAGGSMIGFLEEDVNSYIAKLASTQKEKRVA